MGAAANIRAGKAYAELGVKDKTEADLQKFKKRVMAIGSEVRRVGFAMAATGTAAIASLGAASLMFASIGGSALELSQKTGISVRAITELRYALSQSNSDIDSLETGIRAMQKALEGVNEDGEETANVFSKIGLSVSDLKAMSPDMQFEKIADAIRQLPTASERTAAAMKIFSRAGTGLLPAMLEGAASMKLLRNEAHRLGLTFGQITAEEADRLGDAFTTVWAQVRAIAFVVGKALAPALTRLAQLTSEVLKYVIRFLDANPVITKAAAVAALGLTALGAAVWTVGVSMKVVAWLATATLKPVLKGLYWSVIYLLRGVIWLSVGLYKLAAAVIPALFTPVAGLTALILGLFGAVAYVVAGVMNGFGSLNQFITNTFGEMGDTVSKTWGGIKDALESGSIELAAKVLWASLKLLWVQGTYALMSIWRDWQAQVQESVNALFGLESKVEPRSEAELADIKRLSDAQEELNALREEAAKAAFDANNAPGGGALVGPGVFAAVRAAGTSGTFNSRAAAQMFGGANEYAKKTAEATHQIMLNTERTSRQLEDVLAFA